MGDVVDLPVLDRAREARLKRLYGITIKQYDEMLAKQGGGCAGCGKIPKPGQKRLHVDHDHRRGPGTARAIVCWHCNVAIKWLRDDADIAFNLGNMLRAAGG